MLEIFDRIVNFLGMLVVACAIIDLFDEYCHGDELNEDGDSDE
jgi:hypothetical protein